MSPAVDRSWIFEYRLDSLPGTILEALEEAAMPAGVTRDSTGLFDHEKDRVVVAIEPNLAHPLHMSGLFTLAHSLPRDRDQ